ncbi:unnamed protein product [Caenorhabditis brenneri]
MEAAPKPNYIPSLQELCLPVVIDHIQRDVYSNFPEKLTTKLSDLLLDNLHIPHLAIPEKIMEKIKKHFSITHLTLGQHNYDFFSERQRALQPQMITKLELLSLKNSLITKPNPNGKKKGTCKSLNIVLFLTKNLPPECRQILEALVLQGTSVLFPQGWIRDLHKSFPALKVLDITGCSLANTEFKLLCDTYKNLTHLSIGKTKVNDLTGIEALTELTYLSLEDLEYKKEPNFYSVFLLEKLVVLDISSNTSSASTAKLLTKRKTSLSNLQFLACCGNELTDEIVGVLFQQNPKLQNMAVVNTIYDKTTPEEFAKLKEGAKFFNVADLVSCAESLMIYHSHEQRCQYVLNHMREFVRNELGAHDPLDVKKCARGLVQVLRNNAIINKEKLEVLNCFLFIFNHPTVSTIFSMKEKEEIARAVIKVLAVTNWSSNTNPEGCYDMFLIGSKLLSNTLILQNLPELSTLAAVTMFKTLSKELRFNGQVFLHTGNMLYFNRDRLLKPGQFTDTEISHFKTSLLICFEEDTGHNSIHFLAYMKLLSMALSISTERGFRTDELLPTILKKIGPYRGNQRLVEMCFANALKLYISEQESSRKKYSKWNVFLILRPP